MSQQPNNNERARDGGAQGRIMSSTITTTSRRFFRLAAIVAMASAPACVHDASNDPTNDDFDGVENDIDTEVARDLDTVVVPGDPIYTQTTTSVGTDWQLQTVSGYALDGDGSFYNEPVYVLNNASGIDASPLPADIKLDLKFGITGENVYSVSADTVNEIQVSKQLGSLTPALAAIAEPLDGPQTDPTATQNIVAGPTGPADGLFSRCNNQIVTMTKSVAVNTPLSVNKDLGDGFTGTLTMTGDVTANAQMTVTIEQKRFKLLGWCIPYAVRFDNVRASGNAHLGPTIGLNGTVGYSKSWDTEVAKISLGSIDFVIGVVPVHIPLALPISVGLDLTANATANVTYNTSQSADGNFNYTCTLSGCTGTANYSLTGSQTPTYTASGQTRVQPSVWAQAGFRAALYDEWLAYAQVGVRPYARGDVWGYYGNSCGDADGNGTNETVSALTFDLDWQVHLTGQASAFGMTPTKWDDLYHTGRKHIGFWNLLSGSNGHKPMLGGSATAIKGTSQAYTAKMRPCWPYADSINYNLAWGNGTTTSTSSVPQTAKSLSNTWANTGTYSLGLTAQSDGHGRTLSGTTNRSVQVIGGWTPWLDRDNPTGEGDYETLAEFVAAGQVCANPTGIECQTTSGVNYTQTGEVYSCTPTSGGQCVKANQSDGACNDYRVRFYCP